MIVLGPTSRKRMEGVDPNLVRVFERAAAQATKDLDFFILEGVRSKEQMFINYGKGRTAAQCTAKGVPAVYAKPKENKVTWLNDPLASNHRVMPDGWGKAIDAAPYPLDWNDSKRFQKMAELILKCANELGVKVRWGRDWNMNGRYEEKGETDGPHFELVK